MKATAQLPCRQQDPDLWFPVGTSGPSLRQAEAAKAACALCPLIDPCLSYALETGPVVGIWGGTDENERVPLYHRAEPTPSGQRLELIRALATPIER